MDIKDEIIELANNALEARQWSDDEKAIKALNLVFRMTRNDFQAIKSCNMDGTFGNAFLQMLYLNIPTNRYEEDEIFKRAYYLLSKRIKETNYDFSSIDLIRSRVALVTKWENIFREMIAENLTILNTLVSERVNSTDAYSLMLYTDLVGLGQYCRIFADYNEKKMILTKQIEEGYFDTIASRDDIVSLGAQLHQCLYEELF